MSSSVLTWGADPGSTPRLASERLRLLERSHHAMWNYLTYRDAIGIVGFDPAELYPGGTTRLDPATWADLGWLTCFAGPPASAVDAMRDAVMRRAPQPVQPGPHRAAARRRGRRARPRPRRRLRGHRHRGRPGRHRAVAHGGRRPRRRGHPVGPRLLPRAVGGHRHGRRRRSPCRSTRATAIASIPTSSPRRSPRARARSSSSTRSTRSARCRPQDELAALARLADEHGLLLVHDVTHGSIVIDPDVPFALAAGARAHRQRGRHVLGLALLRDGRRADRLPRRAVAPHAQLPAAEGRADAPEHEPHRPARRARGAARRALPRARAGRSCAATSPICRATLDGVDGLALTTVAGARAGLRAGHVGRRRHVAGADGRAVRAPRRHLSRRRDGLDRRRDDAAAEPLAARSVGDGAPARDAARGDRRGGVRALARAGRGAAGGQGHAAGDRPRRDRAEAGA